MKASIALRRAGLGVLVAAGVLVGLGLLRAFFGPDDERPWMEPLRAAIRTQLEVPPSHRLETMTYSFDESGAVPGLRYIVAWYPGIEAPDRVFSVLAYRDPRSEGLLRRFVRPEYHVLSRLDDWGAAAAGWAPTSPDDALNACAELVTLLGPRADPDDFVFGLASEPVRQRERLESLGRPDDPSTRDAWLAELDRALHPPAVRAFEDGWTADAWLVEHGRTTRYTCELTTGEGGLEASLAVTDSIRWVAARAETG